MDLYTLLCMLPPAIVEFFILNDLIKDMDAHRYAEIEEAKRKSALISKAKFNNFMLSQQMKDYTPSHIIVPPLSQDSSEVFKHVIFKLNKNEELSPLINKIIAYISSEYLINLMRNIGDLEIVRMKKSDNQISKRLLGSYYTDTNKIHLYDKDIDTLSHEFLHAISSFVKDDFSFSGFCRRSSYGSYFKGLNEGYTEVLNHRIFGAKNISYNENRIICLLIELLFDDYHDMECAYFCNNVDLVIEAFLKYGTKDEFLYIIEQLDIFTILSRDETNDMEVINLLKEIISRTNDYDKIVKCDEMIESESKLANRSFVKRLVRK